MAKLNEKVNSLNNLFYTQLEKHISINQHSYIIKEFVKRW